MQQAFYCTVTVSEILVLVLVSQVLVLASLVLVLVLVLVGLVLVLVYPVIKHHWLLVTNLSHVRKC